MCIILSRRANIQRCICVGSLPVPARRGVASADTRSQRREGRFAFLHVPMTSFDPTNYCERELNLKKCTTSKDRLGDSTLAHFSRIASPRPPARRAGLVRGEFAHRVCRCGICVDCVVHPPLPGKCFPTVPSCPRLGLGC